MQVYVTFKSCKTLIHKCVTFQQSQEALIFMYLLDTLIASEVTGWCSDSSDKLTVHWESV